MWCSGALTAPPVRPVPLVGMASKSPAPRCTQQCPGGSGLSGVSVCLSLIEGMALFSPSCDCYHLFPSIVFVDVFLF